MPLNNQLWKQHITSEALRLIFPLIALYAIFAIIIWTLTFTGIFNFNPAGDIIAWHYYDMLFGFTYIGLLGFILTAGPEWANVKKVAGKELILVVIAWMFCRFSFWFLEVLTIYPTMFSHLLLSGWLIWRLIPLLINTMMSRLILTISALYLAQILFFATHLEWVEISLLSVSRLTAGIFVIMILQVLKPISLVIMNDSITQKHIDEVFIPRPPRRRFAIFCLALFIAIDFSTTNAMFIISADLEAYISFAVMASLLNILNDWHIKNSIFSIFAMPLYLIYWFIAIGMLIFGLEKLAIFDYLSMANAELHARHLIFMGAIGLAIFMVLLIAGRRHTGRSLNLSIKIKFALLCIISSVISRGLMPIILPDQIELIYQISALFWVLAFSLYLSEFLPFFLRKNL